jgi:hypothetical protein
VCTASGTFFGRRSWRGAFEPDWQDEASQWWGGPTSEGDDGDAATLLALDFDALALSLADIPLHELLDIPAERCQHAAAAYAADTAAFVAAMTVSGRNAPVERVEAHLTGGHAEAAIIAAPVAPGVEPAAVESASSRVVTPQSAPTPSAVKAHTSTSSIAAKSIAPPPQAAAAADDDDDDDDDDAFLNEMLGKRGNIV